jgi:phosphatidylinositol glycan class Q protein
MFDSYFELGKRIRKHYLSPGVIMHLASGRFIPPLHRRSLYSLQYSMLPVKRPSAADLWKQLNGRNNDVVSARTRSGNGHLSTNVRGVVPTIGGRKGREASNGI